MFFSRKTQQVQTPAETVQPTPEVANGIAFGDEMLAPEEATSGFLLAGTSGSGKTSLLRKWQQSTLPNIIAGSDQRALIYDAKQNELPLLTAICPHAEIITLNPFDARGAAWAMNDDIREPRVAVELAFTLIPPAAENSPFFSDASRHLLYGCMLSYMLSGHDWTFGDLLRGIKTAKRLKAILKKHVHTRELISQYFHDKRLLSNILSTLATKVSLPYEPIASAWEWARRKVSLSEWARSERIYVLGNSEISRAAIDAINRAIFLRAVQVTLNQSESRTRRSFFVIDELADIGKLDGLVSLAKKGRSKGSVLAISFQSISGLRDQRMYGTHITDEIVGQLGNRFIGRLECPVTAEWASKLIGDQEIESISTSVTHSKDGTSNSETRQLTVKPAVLPVEFMNVTPCSRENGLTGIFLTRTSGAYSVTLDGKTLFDEELIPPAPDVPDFVPRPMEAQLLRPWTPEEANKFGANPTSKSRSRAKPKRAAAAFDLLDGLDDLDSETK